MNDNRDKLKQLAKGYSNLTSDDIGFDIDLWQYLDSGEYNKRAVDACISLLRWYRQENGRIDRQSGFYQYIQQLKEQGYDIKI
ncbi:hypothetical protein [Prevotella veroralis]|uniref:Uncharacterized protein n=1 Tax=Prevotella veroralis F0319 TaxID=649761 RepID=C9MT69_9BACT|nr:hypothetical protein [Prevotella veroralis]EEX17264.1 hypothetical protein HMPREF0973_02840 [Prevotella veroralis F0319]QUB40782.1 hypothetical protein J5A55_00465 [Prevotella veroralis]